MPNYVIKLGTIRTILKLSNQSFPVEASGVLLCKKSHNGFILYVAPCSSKENTTVSFIIRDIEIKKVKANNPTLQFCGCFHSHVIGPAYPSKMDCSGKKSPGELWLIYSARYKQLRLFSWDKTKFFQKNFTLI